MKKTLLAVAALVVLAVPAVSMAAAPRPGAYVSGFIGVTVPSDSDVTTINFSNGDTFKDRVTYDPSIDIGGTGGYDFGYVRLEGELSYKHAEIRSITNITNPANPVPFLRPDGSLGAFAMMVNCFFDLHNDTPVTPYFGGGIGFASLHQSDTTVAGQPGLLYEEDDDAVFAYQAGGGLEIALNRRLSLDLGYRYFGTTEARFDNSFFNTNERKFESHNGTVGIRVKF